MAQVKKAAVRDAILASALAQFAERSYAGTTLADIAAGAGVATSNIYVYFGSKLDVLFAVYQPWLVERLDRLQDELAAVEDPRARLGRILLALWRDIPADGNGFAHNLMQAISSLAPEDRYSRELLLLAEQRVSALLRDCLPPSRHALVEGDRLAHLLFMAFDGFVINQRLNGPSRRVEAIVDMVAGLLLPEPGSDGGGRV